MGNVWEIDKFENEQNKFIITCISVQTHLVYPDMHYPLIFFQSDFHHNLDVLLRLHHLYLHFFLALFPNEFLDF